MNADPMTIVSDAVVRLERAWNNADGAGYRDLFSDDAHFVNIRGEHHHGRMAIAQGHQAIFDTIYKGSTVRYSVLESETILDGCIPVAVRARLEAPSGPMQGTHNSILRRPYPRERRLEDPRFPQHARRRKRRLTD
jgi:uncharacterized protein (TIGR02246 family)